MLRKLFHRLRASLRRGKVEREMDAELRFHLEMEMAENMRRGMSEEEARLAALRSFGGVEPVKEAYRDLSRFRRIEEVWQDLRYGARMLRKHPGFTAAAVLTLALGIGANVAVFSVVNAVLLRPLPYPEPDRLVMLQNQFLARNLKNAGVSVADYADYRGQKQIFEEVAAIAGANFNFSGADRPESVSGVFVTAGFFPLLGLKPVVGRVFSEDEDRPGYNRVVVLSESLWKRRFGADPGVIGRTLQIDDQSHTVVGVVPPAPESLGPNEVFTPAAFTPEQMNHAVRGGRFLFALARLKRGVPLARAQAEMNVFAQALAKEFPNAFPPESGWGIRIDSLRERWIGDVRLALWVLMGAVGFVLLIACANVASLLLGRATGRAREIGVDWQVLGFTLGISLLTGLLAGLAPLLEANRRNLHEGLKDGARGGAGSPRQNRARGLLVVAEVALSLILLVGAGLLLQSFVRLQRVDPGFQPQNALTFRVPLSSTRYPEQAQRQRQKKIIIEDGRNLLHRRRRREHRGNAERGRVSPLLLSLRCLCVLCACGGEVVFTKSSSYFLTDPKRA